MAGTREIINGQVHAEADIDHSKSSPDDIWNAIHLPLSKQSAHLAWYGSYTVDLTGEPNHAHIVGNAGSRFPVTVELYDERTSQIVIGQIENLRSDANDRVLLTREQWQFSISKMSDYRSVFTVRLYESWGCRPPGGIFGRRQQLSQPRTRVRKLFEYFGLDRIAFIDGDDEILG